MLYKLLIILCVFSMGIAVHAENAVKSKKKMKKTVVTEETDENGKTTKKTETIESDADEAPISKNKKSGLHDKVADGEYGLAGCGLGSIIFGAKPGMVQIFSSTTNGLYGNQTFGITSGTSNCDVQEMGMAAAQFIEVNREAITKEAARGEGESLNNLAAIFQCSNQTLFSQKMQSEYGSVFSPEKDSFGTTRSIIQSIKSDDKLSQTCAKLG